MRRPEKILAALLAYAAFTGMARSQSLSLEKKARPVVEDLNGAAIDIPFFYVRRRVYRLEGPSQKRPYLVDAHGRLTPISQGRGGLASGLRRDNPHFSAAIRPSWDQWKKSGKQWGDPEECFLDLTDRQSGAVKTFDIGDCGYDGRNGRTLIGWHKTRNLLYSDLGASSSSGPGSVVYQFDADGGAWTEITTKDAAGLFMSPDGRWIVWEQGGDHAVNVVPLGEGPGRKMVHSKQIVAYDIENNRNYRITHDVSYNSFAGWAHSRSGGN